MADNPSLNLYAPSWANVSINYSVSGGKILETSDISNLKWSAKVDVGEQRGTGRYVTKTTEGQVKFAASGEMYMDGLDVLLDALREKAPTRNNRRIVSLVHFDLMVLHDVPGSDAIFTTKISGCRLTGIDGDHKEGTDPEKVPVEFHPMLIERLINGEWVTL